MMICDCTPSCGAVSARSKYITFYWVFVVCCMGRGRYGYEIVSKHIMAEIVRDCAMGCAPSAWYREKSDGSPSNGVNVLVLKGLVDGHTRIPRMNRVRQERLLPPRVSFCQSALAVVGP